MKKIFSVFLAAAAGFQASCGAVQAPVPAEVSARITRQFLSTDATQYRPKGYKGGKAYGGGEYVHYAVVSLWSSALECAAKSGDSTLLKELAGKLQEVRRKPGVFHNMRHVDLSIVGAVPLAISSVCDAGQEIRELGLGYADRQWAPPTEGDDWGERWYEAIPLEEREAWFEKGYTPETRLWIDDMYMITLLQSWAYRVTGDRKYIDRSAREMCLYLERLQRSDGLFDHAPGVPFVWGRGDGWMAAGMAMNLKYLPAESEWRPPILSGYRKMMATLLKCQRSSGLWGQLVDDAGSWDETSGSAMFAYAMAEGVNNGWLADRDIYAHAVDKAYAALVARLDGNGNLKGVCVGTGRRNSREWYMSRPTCVGDPHGQAPMLWLCGALMDRKAREDGPKGVKYRGIFINDEDWGLRPWAVKHFGKTEQIGERAYAMIFDLMKANGLNLIWPAMHEGGYEFVSRPGNMALAAKYGICVGTSHCEPMLRNNCYLSKDDKKKWSWTKHSDFIKDYWQWSVDRYATNDVLWTIGMRGIHDGKMNDGDTMQEKIAILEDVFAAQCGMLERAGAGGAPKLFVPYKEVLPIFNAGLKVPEDTTIMWVNDNFGYVRRLGGPQCEGRGGGIYWHVGYYGQPHSYTHLCTTPPAFMWYELVAKCWENGVRDVWMVNVGDVFQAEIAIYALGKFAESPDSWGPDAQERVLSAWAGENFGAEAKNRVAAHVAEYFALGFIRKPEHMCVQWARAIPDALKDELLRRYAAFYAEDEAIESSLCPEMRDLYFRKVGFQARFLAHAGIIHLEKRDKAYARSVLDPLYERWDGLEGGKWAGFWIDTIDERTGPYQPTPHNRWSSQMQWAWNEPGNPDEKNRRGSSRSDYVATAYEQERAKGLAEPRWLEPIVNEAANGGAWTRVKGLGTCGEALALLPVRPGAGAGARLEYALPGGMSSLVVQFLPDFALWPGMKLRVGVAFDGGAPQMVEVPKSDSNLGEKDRVRSVAVQDNFIRVDVPVPDGATRAVVTAVDPGVVIDRVGARR